MDQQSWETWLSDLEIEINGDFLKVENSGDDEEYFFRDILQQHSTLAPESEAILSPLVAYGGATISNLGKSDHSQQCPSQTQTPPTTYILSFDNSTVLPGMPKPESNCLIHGNSNVVASKPKSTRASSLLSSEETHENLNYETGVKRGTKKARRSASETIDHITAERKRRRELTERFIALSATIPGLKKIDKASILSEATNYVKQLQERVKELEEETKKIMKKTQEYAIADIDVGTLFTDINSDDNCYTPNVLPEVKARISDKQVLIRILCHKRKCTMVKLLDELKNLHLNVFGNSVMPFGSCTLDITIIAQMGEEYAITMKDVVKSLRTLLE